MITDVEIIGFKRFRHGRFKLAPLTILTGLNGSGKTSLIQALLIAREATGSENILKLNGPFGLQLGTAEDVLNWGSEPPIKINIRDEATGASIWNFDMASTDSLYLGIAKRPGTPPTAFNRQPRSFTYLCAERLGPRSVLSISPVPENQLEVGVQGEHCGHVLSILGNKLLEDVTRKHPSRIGDSPTLLKYEVEQWLGEVARPVEITAERLGNSSIAKMTFRSPGAEWVSAPNMGFGVSYALPVILAGLLASPGGLMIVENPEAHLHPAGQSRMGVFLAWLAGKGIQVILETHSDHVLNGIRRAIAEDLFLPPSYALAYFFGTPISDTGEDSIEQLAFDASGSISHWPTGFFDQFQVDVASLGRIRRQR